MNAEHLLVPESKEILETEEEKSRGEGMSQGHRAPNGQKRNNSSN